MKPFILFIISPHAVWSLDHNTVKILDPSINQFDLSVMNFYGEATGWQIFVWSALKGKLCLFIFIM